MRAHIAIFAIVTLASSLVRAQPPDVATLALETLTAPEERLPELVEQLRESGFPGLDAVLSLQPGEETEIRWRQVVNAVAGQYDAHASRLFWHTDLDAALAEAQRLDRPVVSLRMLGQLTEDLSCANSRYFRTVLYANHEVSDWLRHNVVLHWHSERPVPQITIDMGDGRRIERTITGNSAHMVLDQRGRPVEVIPGLVGPDTFLANLSAAHGVALEVSRLEEPLRTDRLAEWHRERAAAPVFSPVRFLPTAGGLPTAFDAAPLAVSKTGIERPMLNLMNSTSSETAPTAPEAMNLAFSKGIVESPFLDAMNQTGSVNWAVSTEAWQPILDRLDDGSIALMREKVGEEDLAATVESFQRGLWEDTRLNEDTLHPQIRGWFIEGEVGEDPIALSDRVYTELFLTPPEDPWLGLVPENTYAALDGEGLLLP